MIQLVKLHRKKPFYFFKQNNTQEYVNRSDIAPLGQIAPWMIGYRQLYHPLHSQIQTLIVARLSRALSHGAQLRISLTDLLLGLAAFSITFAVGLHNLSEEQLDQRLRSKRCQVVRRSLKPFVGDLLGSRFNNPIVELEFCAIETSPIGTYSAVLDAELITELKRLHDLTKIWVYSDAENFIPADIDQLRIEFPEIQFESVNQQQRFPLTPLLPSYKWYRWLTLFVLSYLCLILGSMVIKNRGKAFSANSVG